MSLNTKFIISLAVLVLVLGSIRLVIDLPKIFEKNSETNRPAEKSKVDDTINNIHEEVKRTKPDESSSDCPDAWYINKMPTYGEERTSNEYLMKDGKRYDMSEFDESWLRDYCNMEPQILY